MLRKAVLPVLLAVALSAPSFAATTVVVAGSPSAVAAGQSTMALAAVRNASTTSQAVTVTLAITGPCANLFPAKVGVAAVTLKPGETRRVGISYALPNMACSGSYTLTATVRNSAGTIIATNTAHITVGPRT